MQSEFSTFFTLGLQHISDLEGYDHIVFIIALCAAYDFSAWKRLAILVTAFTLGHCVTLMLAGLKIVTPMYALVEKLIPVTIALTAIYNVWSRKQADLSASKNLKYGLALVFGLVHGLGFSNYFRELLGAQASILTPLLAFNFGIEAGQLCIVAVIMAIAFVAKTYLKVKPETWNIFVSGASFGIALLLLLK
jgi:hypothetical protein